MKFFTGTRYFASNFYPSGSNFKEARFHIPHQFEIECVKTSSDCHIYSKPLYPESIGSNEHIGLDKLMINKTKMKAPENSVGSDINFLSTMSDFYVFTKTGVFWLSWNNQKGKLENILSWKKVEIDDVQEMIMCKQVTLKNYHTFDKKPPLNLIGCIIIDTNKQLLLHVYESKFEDGTVKWEKIRDPVVNPQILNLDKDDEVHTLEVRVSDFDEVSFLIISKKAVVYEINKIYEDLQKLINQVWTELCKPRNEWTDLAKNTQICAKVINSRYHFMKTLDNDLAVIDYFTGNSKILKIGNKIQNTLDKCEFKTFNSFHPDQLNENWENAKLFFDYSPYLSDENYGGYQTYFDRDIFYSLVPPVKGKIFEVKNYIPEDFTCTAYGCEQKLGNNLCHGDEDGAWKLSAKKCFITDYKNKTFKQKEVLERASESTTTIDFCEEKSLLRVDAGNPQHFCENGMSCSIKESLCSNSGIIGKFYDLLVGDCETVLKCSSLFVLEKWDGHNYDSYNSTEITLKKCRERFNNLISSYWTTHLQDNKTDNTDCLKTSSNKQNSDLIVTTEYEHSKINTNVFLIIYLSTGFVVLLLILFIAVMIKKYKTTIHEAERGVLSLPHPEPIEQSQKEEEHICL